MLKQPVGQKRLTNVAMIKYRVSKKKYPSFPSLPFLTFSSLASKSLAIKIKPSIGEMECTKILSETFFTNFFP